jgi:outer membrane receptor for ferrienterochelin and colicin
MMTVLPAIAAGADGTISGKVSEYLKNREVTGVLVEVVGTGHSTLSDESGEFKLLNIPVGNYNVKFSAEGFQPVVKTDVIVRPKRITYVNVELQVQLLELKETVEVSGSYFRKSEMNPHSVLNISTEEVRRAPGTIGDFIRMLKSMPGITGMGDENTDLMVRGGSPLENGFFIDNIEVPYISHLPRIGSTGGVISGLNQDLIQNIDFFSGGFSANFGHRLSSITDIKLREGNRSEFDGQVDFNLGQAGGVLEGPMPGGKGSWLIAAKKSYFEMLKKANILQVDAVPNTFDTQVKLTLDLSAKHKISIMDIYLKGDYEEDYDGGMAHETNLYTQNTVGINWVANWSDRFISNTSVSYSFLDRTDGEDIYYWWNDTNFRWSTDNLASYYILRNQNYLFFNDRNKLMFGFQVKYKTEQIDQNLSEYLNWMGDTVPERILNYDYKTINSSLFFSFIWKPFKRLTATLGLRGDHWSAHEDYRLSPRISLSYEFNSKFSLNGGYGIFYQSLPMNLLAYWPKSQDLHQMRAIHYTAGLEFFPGAGTKITLEAYNKDYKYLPINPLAPRDLIIDNLIDSYYVPYSMVDVGTGYSRGIELLVHKKLIKKFYGIFSFSYFRSRYKDLEGVFRNRLFDNRYIVNVSGGYRPNNKWQMSVKWTMVGGSPYTPFDVERSTAERAGYYDLSRYLGARLPAYSTLNVRLDRRFYFGKSSIIIYLDIWNILNRKNIYEYEWNSAAGVPEGEQQLTLLPFLGIEYEF